MPARLQRYRRWLLAAVTALLAVGVTVALVDDDHDGRVDTVIVTVPAHQAAVDGADADTKRDDNIALTPAVKQVASTVQKDPERFDFGDHLRGHDTTNAGVLTGPLAAQEWPGCKTAFVGSFSQRTSAVKAIALHYTAGPNRAGWSDLDGLTVYSNSPRNQASWHFAVDREGHCTYNVPLKYKAWTIANLNSQTINLEIVGTGSEPDYAGAAGMKTVRSIVRRAAALYGIPLRLGAVDGACHVTRPGIITHWMGGPCSGGHHDINPYKLGPVVDFIAAPAPLTITARDRRACRRVNRWRTAGKPTGKAAADALARRKRLHARGLTCETKGLARRAG